MGIAFLFFFFSGFNGNCGLQNHLTKMFSSSRVFLIEFLFILINCNIVIHISQLIVNHPFLFIRTTQNQWDIVFIDFCQYCEKGISLGLCLLVILKSNWIFYRSTQSFFFIGLFIYLLSSYLPFLSLIEVGKQH